MIELPNRQWQALRLQSLSREMLELAKLGDWVSIAELEKQRRKLIEDLFRPPLLPDPDHVLAASVRYVLDCDSEMLRLGHEAMNHLSQQLQTLAQGRKANIAYIELQK